MSRHLMRSVAYIENLKFCVVMHVGNLLYFFLCICISVLAHVCFFKARLLTMEPFQTDISR